MYFLQLKKKQQKHTLLKKGKQIVLAHKANFNNDSRAVYFNDAVL